MDNFQSKSVRNMIKTLTIRAIRPTKHVTKRQFRTVDNRVAPHQHTLNNTVNNFNSRVNWGESLERLEIKINTGTKTNDTCTCRI